MKYTQAWEYFSLPVEVLWRLSQQLFSWSFFAYIADKTSWLKLLVLTLGCTRIPSTNCIKILSLNLPSSLKDHCEKLVVKKITELIEPSALADYRNCHCYRPKNALPKNIKQSSILSSSIYENIYNVNI